MYSQLTAPLGAPTETHTHTHTQQQQCGGADVFKSLGSISSELVDKQLLLDWIINQLDVRGQEVMAHRLTFQNSENIYSVQNPNHLDQH